MGQLHFHLFQQSEENQNEVDKGIMSAELTVASAYKEHKFNLDNQKFGKILSYSQGEKVSIFPVVKERQNCRLMELVFICKRMNK